MVAEKSDGEEEVGVEIVRGGGGGDGSNFSGNKHSKRLAYSRRTQLVVVARNKSVTMGWWFEFPKG